MIQRVKNSLQKLFPSCCRLWHACFCCSDLPKGFFKTSLFLTLCCNMCNLSPHFLCVSQNDVWAEVSGFPHERLRVFTDEGLLVVAGCVVPRDAVVIPIVVDTETSLHRHSTGVQQILCIIWLSHRTFKNAMETFVYG